MNKAARPSARNPKNGSPAAKAAIVPTPWIAILVSLENGFDYFVSRIAIENDYAEYLREREGGSAGVAIEKARNDDVEFWFNEQFNLADVKRLGIIVKRPSYEQMVSSMVEGAVTDGISSTRLITVLS